MPQPSQIRMHEVGFCAEVKSWADALLAEHPEWPFSKAAIEEYGTGNYKRQDLRIYRKGSDTPVLTGEVKMPGTPEGRSPYDSALMQDAFNQADNIQAPYFFTWNVNTFVLFDRAKYRLPMIERRLRDWDLGLDLSSPGDCRRADVQARLRDKFLPDFFAQFAAIVLGRAGEWGKPPDEVFIRSLESHLVWPVIGTRDYLAEACAKEPAFAHKLQAWMAEEMNWTFDPANAENWRNTLDNAARTLCYVFSNRAIFYEAIRARYPESLPPLKMPQQCAKGHQGIYGRFRAVFQQAVVETGDYEPVFYPQVRDWAGALVFASDIACQGWKGVFAHLAEYDFHKLPYDIIGHIFQRLISPEERQKFGQFFTKEDLVDIVNAFCIRRAGDIVLDPACGSGSFLVRAYHRKAWLSEQPGSRRTQDSHKPHQELLREILGCDIAVFAAHLATLNLAARQIEDQENYPYVARGNFFAIPRRREEFCVIPGLRLPGGRRERVPVPLPDLDAVIGNPPYVRQEHIPKQKELKRLPGESREAYEARLQATKEYLWELSKGLWPGLNLSGRSDLHCYFWPVAEILGDRPLGDEAARQKAVESLRRLILQTNEPFANDALRVIPVAQAQLWEEGVRAGALLRDRPVEEDQEEQEDAEPAELKEAAAMYRIGQVYAAGKWGRFLRAPDLYFRLMQDYGQRFVRLGELAEVRFGIKSGCDAFFMPRDVTGEVMQKVKHGLPWKDLGLMTPCKRSEVERGKVRIVRAGDNTLHPVETDCLRPEVHSLMEVDRPVVHAKDLDRVVLWAHQPMSRLAHTYVGEYLRWGAERTFASRKSKAVTVPERPTCAARPLWYDLTNAGTGTVFWPMAHKYRHLAPANPEGLVCNHNLFYLQSPKLNDQEAKTLAAVLNSTLVALIKHFYGRYAGSEGTLKTEVVDTLLLEVPDPRGISPQLAHRMTKALEQIAAREVTHLVEDALLECHLEEVMREILRQPPQLPHELMQPDRRELDDAVLELIGVGDRNQRAKLLDELYLETTKYYRYQRTQDIQAMVDRAGNHARRLGAQDLAESIWHLLSEAERGPSVPQWIASVFRDANPVEIPEGTPDALGAGDLFQPNGVIFRSGKEARELGYASPEQAALATELAGLGIRGQIPMPQTAPECHNCLVQLEARLARAKELFGRLAASRTGTQLLQDKTVALLLHWYVRGKKAAPVA